MLLSKKHTEKLFQKFHGSMKDIDVIHIMAKVEIFHQEMLKLIK
jgi:hypothetical protein